MSEKNWTQPRDMGDWMRSMEKRMLAVERQSSVTTAADILGPGIAPQAVEIPDWSGDETEFNGLYASRPGALHSPDSAKWWIGTSLAFPDGSGLQHVWDYRSDPPVAKVRIFSIVGDNRVFGAWSTV